MIRFIVKRMRKDPSCGAEWENLEILEADCPEIEEVLKRGGLSETGYDVSEVIAVERVMELETSA